ncbi:transposase [Kribbella sp. NBC_00359]|uniref:transposase n=1 Tax=Kribbella sp. NBC_00359 TaxID=2975966 RepID=UPI003FA5A6BC
MRPAPACSNWRASARKGAARLLVEVGDISRFPDRNHFASWTGTAPIDASSGDHVRHRLSRRGNRQINRALHIMATVQLRRPTKGRAYYDHKKATGRTSLEAMRCLKRRLSDLMYKTMLADLAAHTATGPGGQTGHDSDSSATSSHPNTGSSDKPLRGPAKQHPTTALPTCLDTAGSRTRTGEALQRSSGPSAARRRSSDGWLC